MKVTELGCPGHFICASQCRWRRHTQIGNRYRVSSVGDYYDERGRRQTLGSPADSWFETFVFKTTAKTCRNNDGCGCKDVDFSEIDSQRYPTAGEAQRGHERFVKKYTKRAVGGQSGS